MVRRARLNPAGLHWEQFVVGERDGRAVGVAQLRRHRDGTKELASLVVEPGAREHGIATQMVDALLADETAAVYALIDRRFADHFARWGFRQAGPGELPHPDFVVLPAGVAWRTDPADAAALRASYERTVAAAGRGPRIQPIPAHLLSAARPAPRITSQRTGRQRERRAAGARGRKAEPEVRSSQVVGCCVTAEAGRRWPARRCR